MRSRPGAALLRHGLRQVGSRVCLESRNLPHAEEVAGGGHGTRPLYIGGFSSKKQEVEPRGRKRQGKPTRDAYSIVITFLGGTADTPVADFARTSGADTGAALWSLSVAAELLPAALYTPDR